MGDIAVADDEHDLYPVHEEDNVPEKPPHERQARYLRDALQAYFPERWVTGDICMYWEERAFPLYAAPDVLVTEGPRPDPEPGVYLRWQDLPPLLVAEVGSRSTFVRDEGPKLDIYGLELRVPEYLYFHPIRRDLRFYRLVGREYQAVAPDERGRVHSETLDVEFGEDAEGFLRVFSMAGEMLLTHEESERARRQAEARALTAERRLAEVEAELRRLHEGRGAG